METWTDQWYPYTNEDHIAWGHGYGSGYDRGRELGRREGYDKAVADVVEPLLRAMKEQMPRLPDQVRAKAFMARQRAPLGVERSARERAAQVRACRASWGSHW